MLLGTIYYSLQGPRKGFQGGELHDLTQKGEDNAGVVATICSTQVSPQDHHPGRRASRVFIRSHDDVQSEATSPDSQGTSWVGNVSVFGTSRCMVYLFSKPCWGWDSLHQFFVLLLLSGIYASFMLGTSTPEDKDWQLGKLAGSSTLTYFREISGAAQTSQYKQGTMRKGKGRERNALYGNKKNRFCLIMSNILLGKGITTIWNHSIITVFFIHAAVGLGVNIGTCVTTECLWFLFPLWFCRCVYSDIVWDTPSNTQVMICNGKLKHRWPLTAVNSNIK